VRLAALFVAVTIVRTAAADGPTILDAEVKADGVLLPARWIDEDPRLAADLPTNATRVTEMWLRKGDEVRHCYQVSYVAGAASGTIRAALLNRGGSGSTNPLIVLVQKGFVIVSGVDDASMKAAVAPTLLACWRHPMTEYARRTAAFWSATPLLAPVLPLARPLGVPARIARSVSSDDSEAILMFEVARADLRAAGRWLVANGFGGDRAHGWLRSPAKGARTSVDLSKDEVAGDVVLVQIVQGRR
jgi:hypothetical protein